jgi:hypothetical protein
LLCGIVVYGIESFSVAGSPIFRQCRKPSIHCFLSLVVLSWLGFVVDGCRYGPSSDFGWLSSLCEFYVAHLSFLTWLRCKREERGAKSHVPAVFHISEPAPFMSLCLSIRKASFPMPESFIPPLSCDTSAQQLDACH